VVTLQFLQQSKPAVARDRGEGPVLPGAATEIDGHRHEAPRHDPVDPVRHPIGDIPIEGHDRPTPLDRRQSWRPWHLEVGIDHHAMGMPSRPA